MTPRFSSTLVASQMLFAAGQSTGEIRKVLVERIKRASKWDALDTASAWSF